MNRDELAEAKCAEEREKDKAEIGWLKQRVIQVAGDGRRECASLQAELDVARKALEHIATEVFSPGPWEAECAVMRRIARAALSKETTNE